MENISVNKFNSGTGIGIYDNVNGFQLRFHRCDLGKMIKIFKGLMNGELTQYCPKSSTSYNLGKGILISINPNLKRNTLDGNWVEKSRVKVIYSVLVRLKDKELIDDLRRLKAYYRKDKKDLKEKLSVVSITTLNSIVDKLKRREKCVR